MDQFGINFGAALGGMMAMNVLYIMLSSWCRAIYEVARSAQGTHRWVLIVTASLFNAGPWTLVIAVALGIYVHALPWAPWFFGGAAAWLLYVGVLAFVFVWKQRQRQKGQTQPAMISIGGKSLREYLDERPNFINVTSWTFSLVFAPIVLFGLGRDGGFGYWLFLIVLSFVAGRVFAHFAWRIVENDRKSRER